MAMPLFGKAVQKNFRTMIEKIGSVPIEEFVWGPIDASEFLGGPGEGLTHLPTGMWLAMSPVPASSHRARIAVFHMGDGAVYHGSNLALDDMHDVLVGWLTWIRAEAKLADPWCDIRRVVGSVSADDAPDEPFTDAEARSVVQELESMRVTLAARLEGQTEVLERIDIRLGDAAGTVRQLTKRRWMTMFLGALCQVWLEEATQGIMGAVAPQIDAIKKIAGTAGGIIKFVMGDR